MTNQDFHAAAELYLGSDPSTALAQGPRTFGSAANALRFAMEEAAPVSLRGARLTVAGKSLDRTDMLALYRSRRYPLIRKNDILKDRHHEH
ncbi:MAG: hypothetical protein ABIQ30_01630 [Devosia sp.]